MWRASAASRASHATRRPHPWARARRGLSLLEAVAALAIVGATSASILATTGAGVRAAERARRAHEATALAEETLARIALLDNTSLRALPDSLTAGSFPSPFDEYDWHASILGDVQLPGLFSVNVVVEWEGGVQTLTTAMYRRDVSRADGSATGQR